MCFRNLPIEFDAQGRARLKPGATDPYSLTQRPLQIENHRERIEDLCERNDNVCRVDVDRATSVAGDIEVDLNALLELVDRGCAPELAVRIVAPLAWKPTDQSASPRPSGDAGEHDPSTARASGDGEVIQGPATEPLAREELPNAADPP